LSWLFGARSRGHERAVGSHFARYRSFSESAQLLFIEMRKMICSKFGIQEGSVFLRRGFSAAQKSLAEKPKLKIQP
jgi:hypothetical protein